MVSALQSPVELRSKQRAPLVLPPDAQAAKGAADAANAARLAADRRPTDRNIPVPYDMDPEAWPVPLSKIRKMRKRYRKTDLTRDYTREMAVCRANGWWCRNTGTDDDWHGWQQCRGDDPGAKEDIARFEMICRGGATW